MRGRTRVVAIALRTGHVAAMAGVVGGAWLGASHADIRPWAALTALTGLGLVATEVAHGREWPFQGRGVASILQAGQLFFRILHQLLRVQVHLCRQPLSLHLTDAH